MKSTFLLKNKQFILHVVHSKPNSQGEYPCYPRIYTYVQYAPLLSQGGLLFNCLDAAEKRTQIVPVIASDESTFRTCIDCLMQMTPSDENFAIIASLCRKPANELTEADIRKLFNSVENVLLLDNSLTVNQRFTASRKFIYWLGAFDVTYGSGFHLSAVKYKSLIPEPYRSPRSLITPVHKEEQPLLEEIPHNNIAELEQAVLQRVQTAISEIKTVCISVFDTYDNHKKQVESLLQRAIPEEVKDFERWRERSSITTDAGVRKYKIRVAKRLDPQEILAWKAQEVQRLLSTATLEVEWPEQFFSGLNRLLPEECLIYSKNAGEYYLLSPWFLPTDVRVACVIILMIKTNWNRQPIRELDLIQAIREKAKQNGCSLDEALATGLTLQGYKKKTDDDTPEHTIEPGDELEMRVLMLLWSHVKNLRDLGQPITSIFAGLNEGVEGVFGSNKLLRWQKRYGSPIFTFEQLRNQSAADFHLTNRDLDALRERLGHSNSKTTQGYLEQILLRRLNAAINVEFQRRFETSVIFAEQGSDGLLAHGLDERYIDTDLFIPLGDGTACADVHQPQDRLPGEAICAGRTCHAGDGCPHNKIVMNVEQAELMLRTQRYYLGNFDELKADQSYFEAYTLPAILFNFALIEFVKSTRPDIFAAAEMVVKRGIKEAV